MPAVRASAPFEPLSPDLDLDALVEECPNFEYVPRINFDQIDVQGLDAFERVVLIHVIAKGRPLIVEGCQRNLDAWTFSSPWLRDNFGNKCESIMNALQSQFIDLSKLSKHAILRRRRTFRYP